MLSQVRSLRHTIMALVTIASLMGLAPYSALAVSMEYEFTFEVVKVGTVTPVLGMVTGRFTGDAKGDNLIDATELTLFEGDPNNPSQQYRIWTNFEAGIHPFSFAIPPPPAAGSISSSDFNDPGIFQFQYNTSSKKIIALFVQSTKGTIACGDIDSPVGVACDMSQDLIVAADDNPAGVTYTIISQNVDLVPAAAVPEPSTAILLSIGLVGMILYAFSRRLRPVAPRRVPVADVTR